jgi:NADH:ubiquinone reductase (H+-translocating)
MAGQIAEIARDLQADFHALDMSEARVLLVEAGDRVLPEFPPSLSATALRSLMRLGVTTLLEQPVVGIDARSVTVKRPEGSPDRIPTRRVIWAAGVVASSLAGVLAQRAGVNVDQGRHAARVVREHLRGRPTRPFRYRDKGNLATIGRASAVAEIKALRLNGLLAWVTWLTVHLWYLIGFENRLLDARHEQAA